MKNETVYEMVTNKIIEKLENGVVPWRKPFQSNGRNQAVSWKTQKPYRGINTLLLEPGEYATFNQIEQAGGKVKKGEKSHLVVFWKFLEKKEENDQGDEEIEKIPLLRYFRVFEINTQVEGLKSKRKEKKDFEHNPIEECEKIVKGYVNAPDYTWNPNGAYYQPSMDVVNVPPMKDFEKAEGFYSTLFHEMIHSTGHQDRLNRDGVTGIIKFGSQTYSKEELVAELGASMLCAVAGIGNETIDNSTSYIQSWLRVLKNDKTLIVKAGGQAQKASDMILGTTFED